MVFRVALSSGSNVSPVFVGGKYGAFHYDYTTTLTADIDSSVTTINVVDTTGFAATGALWIGYELITYTGTTATSFTGCTRGVSGSTAASHTSGTSVDSAQVAAAATETLVQLNTEDLSAGVSLTASSEMQVTDTGIYSLTFSAQSVNNGNAADNLTIWARVNGTDVPSSASINTTPAPHAGIPGASITCVNLFLSLVANDKVQLYWTTDNGKTALVTWPADTAPAHPSSPAVIATMQQVA